MKIGANLNWLFTEYPMTDRFEAARAAGFQAIELLDPYTHPVEVLKTELNRSGLPLALINTPMLVNGVGRVGSAAVGKEVETFREGFQQAQYYARTLGAEKIHVLSGITQGEEAKETLIANLRWASNEAPDLALTIEPLNTNDTPGYFLSDYSLAAAIISRAALPNLGHQFDIYHAELIGNALSLWDQFHRITSHVQLGGGPGRIEPHLGKLDLSRFAEALGRADYRGVVSGEYGPVGKTEDGLDWMAVCAEGWQRGQNSHSG